MEKEVIPGAAYFDWRAGHVTTAEFLTEYLIDVTPVTDEQGDEVEDYIIMQKSGKLGTRRRRIEAPPPPMRQEELRKKNNMELELACFSSMLKPPEPLRKI